MKKITVAIPTYNREKYLTDCLVSVLNQTEKNFNICIFDNCSDYDIGSAVKKINLNGNIKIIKSEKNIGSFENFKRIKNYNFDSEYLIVFHDDDIMHKDYLKSALNYLEKNKDVVWLGSNINFVKDSNKMFDFKRLNLSNFQKINTEKLITLLLDGFNLGFCSMIYKTSVFKTDINLDELNKKFSKWADRPLLIELSKKGLVAITEEKFINYRVHLGQDSQDNQLKEIPKEGYNLLQYYSTELDAAGFEKANKYMTDQSIISATNSVQSFQQLLILLKGFKERRWFSYRKISFRGFCYLIKFFFNQLFTIK